MWFKNSSITKENNDEGDAPEELSLFERAKLLISDEYSDYEDDQLFNVSVYFDSGKSLNMTEVEKGLVVYLLANKAMESGAARIHTPDGRYVCIDMKKVSYIFVEKCRGRSGD